MSAESKRSTPDIESGGGVDHAGVQVPSERVRRHAQLRHHGGVDGQCAAGRNGTAEQAQAGGHAGHGARSAAAAHGCARPGCAVPLQDLIRGATIQQTQIQRAADPAAG